MVPREPGKQCFHKILEGQRALWYGSFGYWLIRISHTMSNREYNHKHDLKKCVISVNSAVIFIQN